MVERRVSSGGADLPAQNYPDEQERLQAIARLIEMAQEIGVELPADATLD